MISIGRRTGRSRRGEPTPDEEYEVLSDEERRLNDQIRNLEGFIEEAPSIREERLLETRVTLPPLDEDDDIAESAARRESELAGGGDLRDRLGRRHLAAMRRERRTNFLIFLMAAGVVAAFLYWVSLVVQ